jgi:hypothetical protein
VLPVTESAVRASFVNCTKGEAQRMAVPKALDEWPWADLDFLGWRDPAAPQRAYLVTDPGTGLVGVVLRVAAQTGLTRRSMCSLCLTVHTGDGVSLMSARKAGTQGRQGNSVGAYICTDLACSLQVRGRKGTGRALHETITVQEKIERTAANLDAFVQQVLAE